MRARVPCQTSSLSDMLLLWVSHAKMSWIVWESNREGRLSAPSAPDHEHAAGRPSRRRCGARMASVAKRRYCMQYSCGRRKDRVRTTPLRRMPMTLHRIRLALALLIAPASLAAQPGRGVAVDPTSRPLSGVVVLLMDSATNIAARALTNERGEFRLTSPRPGTFRVRALRIGFRPE